MKRLLPLAGALALALLVSPLSAQPSISRVSPGAVTPGKTVDLVISGAKLTEPLSVWTSFGGKVQITTDAAGKKAGNKIQCKVTLPADVQVGVGGIIVGTVGGASDVYLILIDDLTSVADNGKNITAATAQEIKLPTAVDGTSQPGTSDFYKFTAKKGQRVSFEVVAQRIGSTFDGVMWLRDAAGKELAYNDDDEGLGTDCRFAHTFAADGQYVLNVRDNRYQGGQRYRLRVGDFPLVSTTYPAGGQIGSTVQVGFAGPLAKGTLPMNVTIPAGIFGSRLTVGAKFPGGQSSGFATLAASRLPEVMESEPNNDAKVATVIAVPCAINGRFATAADIDFYEFIAKKGQRFNFKAVSRSLGSPSFAFVRIYNAADKKVAETKIGTSDETTLVYNIPADGTYRVSVEDLLHRGGPDHVYRIEIAPPASGFSLEIKNVKNAGKLKYLAAQKGAFVVEVVSKRAGYNGPIVLSVEGAPGAVQLRYNTIAEKKNETKMFVSLAPDTAPGQMLSLRIVGTATVGDKQVKATAATAGIVKVKMPLLAYPPAWLDGVLAVATSTEVAAFYAVGAPADPVFFPSVLGTTKFTIAPKRNDKKFKAGLSIQAETLPSGYSIAVKLVGKVPAEKYEVTLTGPKNAPDGKQTIRLLSYAEHQGKGFIVSTDVAVQVVTPLALTVAPAGPIAPGQKQKVKVTVARFAGDKKSPPQPITLTWKKLPPGVTGAKFTIPADKSEIEVELTAAATAKEVKFAQLTVEAATKFQGKDLKLDSKPVVLEVKKPVVKKPEVKKPAAKKPEAKKPVEKKPAAKKPEVKKPQPPKK